MPGTDGRRQLDLFRDSPATALLNQVGEALGAGQHEAARRALDELGAHDPGHPDLAGLRRLCEALDPRVSAVVSPAALEALIHETSTVLAPQAERLLGPAAPLALAPVWRRLRDGAAVVGLDGLRRPGVGHYWVGVATYHLGKRRKALRWWIRLGWVDPAVLATHAARCPDETLRRAWEEFEQHPGWEVPEAPASAAAWFPAWLFVRHHEVASVFRADEVPGTDPPAAAARAVLALLPQETRGLSDAVVRGRRALQAVAPAFFRYYLRRVGR
jgi:hypothetical protein